MTSSGVSACPHCRWEWGPEAYELYVGDDPEFPGGALVLIDGRTDAARHWALQTLDQLTVRKDGEVYVRRGHVLDAPTFDRRGSKRPFPWEHRFKANYAWYHAGANPDFAGLYRAHGRVRPPRETRSGSATRAGTRSCARTLASRSTTACASSCSSTTTPRGP